MIDQTSIGNWRKTDMDGGPFRAPQPVDRRVPSRPESTSRQSEEVQPAKEEPRTAYRAAVSDHTTKQKKSFKKRFILPVIVIIVIAILGVLGWNAWSNMQTAGSAIDSKKYQAVFFTNGQVYFGKLQVFNNDYLKLTDIFYLQTQSGTSTTGSTNPQNSSTDSSSVQLIKLGSEVHGPEDAMIIAKTQVLFYENLKPDGKVAQSIDKYAGAK
ncbi:MAG: hypothetical protein JWN12_405 [Candidatus Saccharibacteria bacterium]|nr:hypothetical protein [Candidatus Saccharibacteria bacterium]